MAKFLYQLAGAGNLNVYDDPQVLDQADLQAQLTALQEIQTLGDELRSFLAAGGIAGLGLPGFPDLASFDAHIDDEVERLQDILDYFAYDSRVENLTVRDGDWFVPEALESVSHENAGEEGVLAIDGDNSTWWQSNEAGTRSIVFRLRDYKKKMEKIRLRVASAGDGRSQLQNVTIKCANSLGMIDEPQNTIDTGVNFTHSGTAWAEHTLSSSKRGRYIKLEVAASLHANPDQVRIRELQARVTIIKHNK